MIENINERNKIYASSISYKAKLNQEPASYLLQNGLSSSDDLYKDNFVMPSLPTKFCFNRIYVVLPSSEVINNIPIDYSLKAIFSFYKKEHVVNF